MSAFSRGLGLGLGLSLRQRVFSCVPKAAAQSCTQQPMARIAQSIRQSPILQAACNLQTSARFYAKKAAKPSPKRPAVPASSRAPAVPQASKPKPTAPASSRVGATSQASKPKSPSPSSASLVPAPGPAPAAQSPDPPSIVARLAARGRPTVLYEGPSHLWLHISSLAAATFFIAYAVIAYTNVVARPPEGLHWLLPHAYAVICLFMAACGMWFMYSSAFIIRRVTALPKSLLPAAYLKDLQALQAGAGAGAGAGVKGRRMSKQQEQTLRAMQGSPVVLECELSKSIPLLAAKKIYVAPSQVELPFRFSKLRMAGPNDTNASLNPPVDAVGNIAQPFERLGKRSAAAWRELRRGLTREGWSPIKIQGMRYKIDSTRGKVLNMGHTIDQLVRYRPGQKFGYATWRDKLFRI